MIIGGSITSVSLTQTTKTLISSNRYAIFNKHAPETETMVDEPFDPTETYSTQVPPQTPQPPPIFIKDVIINSTYFEIKSTSYSAMMINLYVKDQWYNTNHQYPKCIQITE